MLFTSFSPYYRYKTKPGLRPGFGLISITKFYFLTGPSLPARASTIALNFTTVCFGHALE
jgi:hypothetical protein